MVLLVFSIFLFNLGFPSVLFFGALGSERTNASFKPHLRKQEFWFSSCEHTHEWTEIKTNRLKKVIRRRINLELKSGAVIFRPPKFCKSDIFEFETNYLPGSLSRKDCAC